MLSKLSNTYEAPSFVFDAIRESTKNFSDEKNCFVDLLEEILEADISKPKKLVDFISNVIVLNGTSDKALIKETSINIRNISNLLEENTDFLKYISKIVKNEIAESKKEYKKFFHNMKDSKMVKFFKPFYKDFDSFFAESMIELLPEIFYILDKADLQEILENFCKNDAYTGFDVELKIATPLKSVLNDNLVEKKAAILDNILECSCSN